MTNEKNPFVDVDKLHSAMKELIKYLDGEGLTFAEVRTLLSYTDEFLTSDNTIRNAVELLDKDVLKRPVRENVNSYIG